MTDLRTPTYMEEGSLRVRGRISPLTKEVRNAADRAKDDCGEDEVFYAVIGG